MSKEHYTQPQSRTIETDNARKPAAGAPVRTPGREQERRKQGHSHTCCELAAISNPEQLIDFPTLHGGMCERILFRRERELKWYM